MSKCGHCEATGRGNPCLHALAQVGSLQHGLPRRFAPRSDGFGLQWIATACGLVMTGLGLCRALCGFQALGVFTFRPAIGLRS